VVFDLGYISRDGDVAVLQSKGKTCEFTSAPKGATRQGVVAAAQGLTGMSKDNHVGSPGAPHKRQRETDGRVFPDQAQQAG
jgi:hypothetical protein